MAENQADILAAKRFALDDTIIGHRQEGGLVDIGGTLMYLRANQFRWNGHGGGRENAGFTHDDLSPLGYGVTVPPEVSQQLAIEATDKLRNGELPAAMTTGVEIEAALYGANHETLSRYDDEGNKATEAAHPELLSHMAETTMPKNADGTYRQTALALAHGVALAVIEGAKIAHSRNGAALVYSSITEGGDYRTAELTPHPYLQYFAPMVLQDALLMQQNIPEEVINLFSGIDPHYLQYLRESGILNWPVQALHIHNGVLQQNELADPRLAYAMGSILQTEFAKVATFMLYNTRHIYGVATNLRDVRSVARRLLPTAHDSRVPGTAEELMADMVRALEDGEIHSASRYPKSGQHDRVRFRADGRFRTVESIDAPMNPDLRLVLTWAYLNQIMNVIAIDAIMRTGGDESKVLTYLQTQCGALFKAIPTLGEGSSYTEDLVFNRDGFGGKSSTLKGYTLGELLQSTADIIRYYGEMYPAIRFQSEIVGHSITRTTETTEQADLANYLGIANGRYEPNGDNRGIITDHKHGDLAELIAIQSSATQMQAEALLSARDEKDVAAFFGIT